jgi:hypothetical protein
LQVVAAREGVLRFAAAQRGDWSADFFTTERHNTTFSPERIFSRPLYCTHAVSQEEEKLDCILVKGYLQKEKTMSQNTPAKTRKE